MNYNFALHEALKKIGISQTKLSKLTKISRTVISAIVTGRINATDAEKKKIEKALGKIEWKT